MLGLDSVFTLNVLALLARPVEPPLFHLSILFLTLFRCGSAVTGDALPDGGGAGDVLPLEEEEDDGNVLTGGRGRLEGFG